MLWLFLVPPLVGAALYVIDRTKHPLFVIEHHHPDSYGERKLREVLKDSGSARRSTQA